MEKEEAVKKVNIFSGLDEKFLKHLAKSCKERSFAKNEKTFDK